MSPFVLIRTVVITSHSMSTHAALREKDHDGGNREVTHWSGQRSKWENKFFNSKTDLVTNVFNPVSFCLLPWTSCSINHLFAFLSSVFSLSIYTCSNFPNLKLYPSTSRFIYMCSLSLCLSIPQLNHQGVPLPQILTVLRTNPKTQYIWKLKSHLGPYRTCPGCYRCFPPQVFSKASTMHNSISEYPWLLALLLAL